MPLRNVFEETIKECEEEGLKKGWKPLFSEEEGRRIYEEISAEMVEYSRELKRKWTLPTDMLILYPCHI